MENLRLLAVQDDKGVKSVSLPDGLGLLPENLRYILWDGYPLKTLPPSFCLEMLVELWLKGSHVKKLWNGVLVSMIHVFFLFFLFFYIKVKFFIVENEDGVYYSSMVVIPLCPSEEQP